ncbi:hypothetical protein ABEF92_006261 [Exophiala dermatitidis]|uniref:Uncharacterized protein n=1 Tax=Exophiala dermatitidis (strain ATCC 34100 / CBS 525.76 / NIH/UT8656) TaxID=858893 RepID=H6C885_EXODN|nr:uncharacterized protein HMPREF1120_08278 [Exophiala dermatitidis NIH/UT8656]EHY60312.1 hypothetical protein HMPREF1120_08278 [Exophiala dermatitidis NIH/UT8656]
MPSITPNLVAIALIPLDDFSLWMNQPISIQPCRPMCQTTTSPIIFLLQFANLSSLRPLRTCISLYSVYYCQYCRPSLHVIQSSLICATMNVCCLIVQMAVGDTQPSPRLLDCIVPPTPDLSEGRSDNRGHGTVFDYSCYVLRTTGTQSRSKLVWRRQCEPNKRAS